MAVTASAPPEVEAVILTSLHMHNPMIVKQRLDRPNIFLSASKSVGIKVRTWNFLTAVVMHSIYDQRDFGALAHLLSCATSPSCNPKTLIFSQTKDDVYSVFTFLRDLSAHKTLCPCTMPPSQMVPKSFYSRALGPPRQNRGVFMPLLHLEW